MLILLLLALMCRPESVLYRFSFEWSIFILGLSVLYQRECMRSSRTPTLVMWMLSSEDQWNEDPRWQVWIHLCPWCNPPALPTILWPNPIPSELSPACSSLEECVELLRSIVRNITNTNLIDNGSLWLQASLQSHLVGLASKVECRLHLQPSCSTS